MPPALDYAPYPPRWSRWKKWGGLCGGLLCALAFLNFIPSFPYRTRDIKVCQDCGIERVETQYWGLSYFTSAVDTSLPVHAALVETSHMPAHIHRFAFLCRKTTLFGGGRYYECNTLNRYVYKNAGDLRAGNMLDSLYRSGQIAAAEAWRIRLLDKSTARDAGKEFDLLDVPFEGFATREDFAAWQKEKGI